MRRRDFLGMLLAALTWFAVVAIIGWAAQRTGMELYHERWCKDVGGVYRNGTCFQKEVMK